jgi:DNA-binding transcriptional LysR family regulator
MQGCRSHGLRFCRLLGFVIRTAVNWDDFRIIAAVKEAGTYAGASVSLRIDETTVARRLLRTEHRLGLRLFELTDGKRRPTAQCERILANIEAMAAHVSEIGKIGAGVIGPAGRFRIACTNAVAEEILTPRLGNFLAGNPGLTLQLLTSGGNVQFTRWEADFAIRLRKPDRGDFTISKLTELRLHFIEPAARPVSETIVCRYPENLDFIPEAQFLRERGLDRSSRCIADNWRIMRTLIATRQAAGILPEFLCQDLLSDQQLHVTPVPYKRDVWLLVQNHLKGDAAARLVIGWIRGCFEELCRV